MTRLVLIGLMCCALHAATSISVDSATATSAVVHVVTDQSGNCTYRASRGASLNGSALVNDINTAIRSGSNSDARARSIVTGKNHWFVLGTKGVATISGFTY